MAAFDFINPFREFLTAFEAFLKHQQRKCRANPGEYYPSLMLVNDLYLLNIQHTLEKLNNHVSPSLAANPSHEKATLKLFEYAARAKLALQRVLRSAQLKLAAQNCYHTTSQSALEDVSQSEALLKQLIDSSSIVKDLPLPQKQWLNQNLLTQELQYHQELAKALLQAPAKEKSFAEDAIVLESIQHAHIFPSLILTNTTFGHIEEINKIPKAAPRARL